MWRCSCDRAHRSWRCYFGVSFIPALDQKSKRCGPALPMPRRIAKAVRLLECHLRRKLLHRDRLRMQGNMRIRVFDVRHATILRRATAAARYRCTFSGVGGCTAAGVGDMLPCLEHPEQKKERKILPHHHTQQTSKRISRCVPQS